MEIVLNSYGAKLSINNGAFMLNNSTGSHRIPVKDVDSIFVAKSAVLTSDALILAIENDIRVTLADKVGNVMGCVWSHKYGSISTIRKGQLIFTASQDAVEWIKKVIIQKMQNQLALLLMLQVDTGQKELIVEEAGNKISKLIAKVDALEGFTVREIANNLRAYEGNASKEYFRALNQFIPEKYRFKERSQHPAIDVANAMLNYKVFNKNYWNDIPGNLYIDVPDQVLDPQITVIAVLLDGPCKLYRGEGKVQTSN